MVPLYLVIRYKQNNSLYNVHLFLIDKVLVITDDENLFSYNCYSENSGRALYLQNNVHNLKLPVPTLYAFWKQFISPNYWLLYIFSKISKKQNPARSKLQTALLITD